MAGHPVDEYIPREKFGFVYLQQPDKTFCRLEPSTFSNLRLRWYDINGKEHSDVRLHEGKRFKLGFQLHNTNSMGIKELFEVRLKYPLSLCANRIPDLDHFDKVLQTELDLAKDTGCITNEDDEMYKIIKETEYGALSLFYRSGPAVLKSKVASLSSLILLSADTVIDNIANDTSKECFWQTIRNYQERHRMFSTLVEKLRNGVSVGVKQCIKIYKSIGGNDDDDFEKMEKKMRRGVTTLKLLNALREEISKSWRAEDGEKLWDWMLQTVEAESFTKCREWRSALGKNRETANILPCLIEAHRLTSALGQHAKITFIEEGIQLNPETEERIAMKVFHRQVEQLGSKLNSLFSYENEVTTDDSDHNEVLMLTKLKGLNLEDALQSVVNDINECVDVAVGLKDILVDISGEEEKIEVQRYVDTTLALMGAAIQWYIHTKRYHDVEKVDCYIEE